MEHIKTRSARFWLLCSASVFAYLALVVAHHRSHPSDLDAAIKLVKNEMGYRSEDVRLRSYDIGVFTLKVDFQCMRGGVEERLTVRRWFVNIFPFFKPDFDVEIHAADRGHILPENKSNPVTPS